LPNESEEEGVFSARSGVFGLSESGILLRLRPVTVWAHIPFFLRLLVWIVAGLDPAFMYGDYPKRGGAFVGGIPNVQHRMSNARDWQEFESE
jgi:hypothetical protein